PIVDRGDPRLDEQFQKVLGDAYLNALEALGPPRSSSPSGAELQERQAAASAKLVSLRQARAKEIWNRLRFELGVAGSGLVRSAHVVHDSLDRNRAGIWTALALPAGRYGQVT